MKSSVNPYRYAEEVFGDHFTGRQEELKTLISRLESGINVSLIAPRRTGKTSLIAEATRRLEARKPKAAIARINAMLCVSLADLAGALAEAAYQSAGRGYSSRGIADFIKRLRVSPTVTLDAKGNPTFSFEPRLCASDARRSFESVFEIMSEVANRRVATIVLDEFQHVLSLGEEVSGFFKALADRYPKVGLVLAGSDRHMMESLIAEKTAPLYGMTEPIYLGPIPSPDMVRFVVTRAAQSSKSMDEESANYIVSLAGPLPNDIQRLAFEAWTLAEGPIDKLVVNLGMKRASVHEYSLFEQRLSDLSVNQRRVLQALVIRPETEPCSSEFVHRSGVANASSVLNGLRVLEASQIIRRREGAWVVDNPFLRFALAPARFEVEFSTTISAKPAVKRKT